jgi:O-antigen/teichoic acid export membrane protein
MNKPTSYGPGPTPIREPLRRLSLRANFSWTFAGNLIFVLCQWGMLSVLARLSSPAGVGQFALGLAIATPVMMLTNMQLRQLQATDARRQYPFATYFRLRLVTTALGYLLIVGIVLVSDYEMVTVSIILIVGLARAVEALSDICYGLFQQHEHMDNVARSLMVRGVLALLALALGVLLTGSVLVGVLALLLAWAVVLLGHDAPRCMLLLRQAPAPPARPVEGGSLLHLIGMALPLGIVMMLVTLNASIPRYFIQHHLGAGALGIFAAITYLMVAGTTVVSALGQAVAPRLAAYYAEQQYRQFRRLALQLLGVGALLGGAGVVVALLGGDIILHVLYGAEYARRDLLAGVMLAAGLWYIAACCGFIATASRRISAQPVALSVVVVVAVVLCWWLVPLLFLRGAVLAMIGSSLAGAVSYALLILPVLRLHGAPTNA